MADGGIMNQTKKSLIALLAVIAAILWCAVLTLFIAGRNASYGQVSVVAAPDRTESTENPLFVKEVYEPVIPEGTNIAEDAKMTANGFNDVYTPIKVNDGRTEGQSYWEGENGAYPNILTATFKEAHKIHAIKICLCPQSVWSMRMQTFCVQISEDGEKFTELIPTNDYEFNPDTANEVVMDFDAVECKAVQLVFTGNTGADGAQVAEFEIYSKE